MDVRIEIAGNGGELFVGGDLIFRAFAIAQDGLRGFLIVPKIRRGDARFEGLQAFAMGRSVKDNSGPWRYAASEVHNGAGGLQES